MEVKPQELPNDAEPSSNKDDHHTVPLTLLLTRSHEDRALPKLLWLVACLSNHPTLRVSGATGDLGNSTKLGNAFKPEGSHYPR